MAIPRSIRAALDSRAAGDRGLKPAAWLGFSGIFAIDGGQGEAERRAVGGGGVGLDPDFSAVLFDDALADGESEADAGGADGGAAAEAFEDPRGVLGAHAHAVVADAERLPLSVARGGDVDARR